MAPRKATPIAPVGGRTDGARDVDANARRPSSAWSNERGSCCWPADGLASRAIGREVGCCARRGQQVAGAVRQGPAGRARRRAALGQAQDATARTPIGASWRCSTGRRPWASRVGPRRCSRPHAGRRQRPARLALSARPADRPCRAQVLVPVDRPRVRGQGRRHRRPLPRAARARHRARGRREAGDPGARARAGLPQAAQRPRAHGHAHEYKRRGTSTLFTALKIATGSDQDHARNAGAASSSSTS